MLGPDLRSGLLRVSSPLHFRYQVGKAALVGSARPRAPRDLEAALAVLLAPCLRESSAPYRFRPSLARTFATIRVGPHRAEHASSLSDVSRFAIRVRDQGARRVLRRLLRNSCASTTTTARATASATNPMGEACRGPRRSDQFLDHDRVQFDVHFTKCGPACRARRRQRVRGSRAVLRLGLRRRGRLRGSTRQKSLARHVCAGSRRRAQGDPEVLSERFLSLNWPYRCRPRLRRVPGYAHP